MSRRLTPDRPPPRSIAAPLLTWFARVRRPLPWRRDYDPYQVWIAEVMLQQTQVETVLPYYARWMARFSSPRAVARAPLESVLKAWEGLGYYSRARNLHRAAKAIVERHGGALPDDVEALRALPGIGRYTAGAIASIAFNQREPVVDGNVARVLSRVFALPDAVRSPAGQRALWRLAEQALPPRRPREFNEALMELGALICRPRRPGCPACPLSGLCLARASGAPERYPLAAPRRPRPERRGVMILVTREGRLLVRRRPRRGLWGGLWEFPWTGLAGEEGAGAAARRLLAELGLPADCPTRAAGVLRHGLTHFELALTLRSVHLGLERIPAASARRWVTEAELARLPMARLSHKALAVRDGYAPPDRRPARKSGILTGKAPRR